VIRLLARIWLTGVLLASSAAALACQCGPVGSRDLDDLAARNAYVALVRVSAVELVRESALRNFLGETPSSARLYGTPYQIGGAVARYVLVEQIKGKALTDIPRLEYELATGCTRGVSPGDFLLLFWDQPGTVLEPTACESRIVNLGSYLGFDQLLLAGLRENIASGRPMHPCDLDSGPPSDDATCRQRRKQSEALDKARGNP